MTLIDDTENERLTAVADRGGDKAIKWATGAAVVTVALIAAAVSYRHIRAVALAQGEDRLNATVIPLSVDGLIVVASMAILAESRAGRRRHWLSYVILALGSAASLAANVMHAEPTLTARIIAAWPSTALIGSYELLMRQIRGGFDSKSESHIGIGKTRAARGQSPALRNRASARRTDDEPSHNPGRWVPTKKEQLRLLLAEQVQIGDPRSVYALARDLAPQIGLHPGTARRYLPDLLAERDAIASRKPSRTFRPPTPAQALTRARRHRASSSPNVSTCHAAEGQP